MLSHLPATFSDHMHCGSENTIVLVCLVMLQDHLTWKARDFIERSPSKQVTTLPSVIVVDTVVVEI